ncbi:MAG: hypothetical protein ABWZ99_03700 [Ilumatobacteraceae bacterium]
MTEGTARVRAVAFTLFGVAWLAIAGLIAIVLRLQVPNPEELLADVSERPATWIAANVVLIVTPLTFAVIVPELSRRTGPGSAAQLVVALLLITGGSLVASGVFHGVFGAHLAARFDDQPQPVGLVEAAEVVHAVGDTWWFVGVGGLTATTALVCAVDVRQRRGPALVIWIGVASVLCNLAQFGWFADHFFGVFAAPGTLLQAAWFVAIAFTLIRAHQG